MAIQGRPLPPIPGGEENGVDLVPWKEHDHPLNDYLVVKNSPTLISLRFVKWLEKRLSTTKATNLGIFLAANQLTSPIAIEAG